MDRHLDRRRFLAASGAGALGFTVFGAVSGASRAEAGTPQRFRGYPFSLGVASGDPLPDGVVLWTRLAPEPLAADGRGGMPDRPVPVRWDMAADERFRRVVRRGTAVARPHLGHSVHVDVRRLAPGREYFYRFRVGREVSPVGRTKTAPPPWVRLDHLTFAVASCQAWVGGRYASYRNMAADDLDLVVHVGDYIYERAETETLTDFRLLHAQYKTSPDLQAAHAAFPFAATFDDHEVENNWAGSISQADGEESNARFLEIRAAAFQAYYEHLPLRTRPHGPDLRIYRRLRFGDLVALNVLDTRQYRDDQVDGGFPAAPLDPSALDPERTMTGDAQERWLLRGLHRSRARWNTIAQQTIMAPYDYDTGPGVSVNHDQWDGYAAARERLLDFIRARRPANPVVVTGDWHSSWVNDLNADPRDPESPTLATEFVGTSISSGCGWAAAVAAAVPHNPHVKFFDGDRRGYLRCTVTRGHWRSDYRVVPSPADTASPATTLTSWVVEDGRPGAVPA